VRIPSAQTFEALPGCALVRGLVEDAVAVGLVERELGPEFDSTQLLQPDSSVMTARLQGAAFCLHLTPNCDSLPVPPVGPPSILSPTREVG
jgi:hypothetical protein